MPDRPMSDGELIALIEHELANALNGVSDNAEDIAHDLDLYLGRIPGITRVETKDRRSSRIVSMDIMDAVESTLSEIMQMFSGDEIAYFQPTGQEDEQQSREESDIVNYLFLEEYNGYVLLQMAIKSALLHRNGVIKAYWDKRYRVAYETYEQVPEPAVAGILEPRGPEERVEILEQIVDGEISETAPVTDGATVGVVAVQIPTYSFKLKRISIEQGPRIECVPPEQIKVCADHDTPYLEQVRFAAHEKVETESSLIEQGFDPELVKKLPTYAYSETAGKAARNRKASETAAGSEHHSTRPIQVHECYMAIDYDGDGIAERRKIVKSGSLLLANDEYDRVCLISGTGCVMPNRYQGISLVDRLEDIQAGKTHLLRAIINGAQLSASPRVGVLDGEINIEDVLMSRTGGVVRMRRPDAAVPFPQPQVPESAFSTVTFLDQQRRERGGSAIDLANQATAIAGDTAHGIERTMTAMELYNAMVARTIGETLVRGIFLELHYLLRENYQGAVNAQIGGRWVQSQPSDWRERSKVAIQLGASTAERLRQAAAMRNVIDMHRELWGMQAPLVDMQRSYRAILDAVRLSGIRAPERYFVDPASEEGRQKMAMLEQSSEQQRVQQEQLELIMVQSQQRLAEAEQIKAVSQQQIGALKAENDRLKTQLQSIKADADTALKAQQQSNEFALGVTKLELEAGRDLNRQVAGNR